MRALGWILYLALAAVGLTGFFLRLATGHHLAAYGSYVPWGLWVAAYIYFIGLSAGAFLLSALVYVFGVRKLEPIAPWPWWWPWRASSWLWSPSGLTWATWSASTTSTSGPTSAP
ncbi:polysulphide reductase NrfD [Thermus thermophilus]|nr:polysulphide reductase NrfD [Thermus thermophilus]